MIRIALIDDNPAFLQHIRQIVESCAEFTADMACDTYSSGFEFLRSDSGAYQLVILDMQMEGKSGYETAKRLRETNKAMVIAFISGVVLPEPEHFKVQPYRYLLKNADPEEIRRDIEELLQEARRRCYGEMVEVTGDGRAWRVAARDILYVAKAKRGSLLTVSGGNETSLRSNEKLENWYLQLHPLGFEYAHSSYIVNPKAVTRIMNDELTLSNGEILSISRTCRGKFHENFSLYFRKDYHRGTVQ